MSTHLPYIVVVSDPSQVLLQLPVTETSHHVLITLPLPIHRGGPPSSFQSLKPHHVLITLPRPIHRGGK
ncbi:hypothetical protein J6590_041591 [Homalodisca vitripennis]|nr:hypothetical protein J6590_041591 [Homalodisca vitripennis]